VKLPTVFPRINRTQSIYFRSSNCAHSIRGRGLIKGAVYFIQQAACSSVVLIIWGCAIDFNCLLFSPPCHTCGPPAASHHEVFWRRFKLPRHKQENVGLASRWRFSH